MGGRNLVELIETVLYLLEDTVQIIACNFLHNFALCCCLNANSFGLEVPDFIRFVTFQTTTIPSYLFCFIKKILKNVVATTIRFAFLDIHCGFRQISTMNGLSYFSCFVWDSLYMLCFLWRQRFGLAVVNNCN